MHTPRTRRRRAQLFFSVALVATVGACAPPAQLARQQAANATARGSEAAVVTAGSAAGVRPDGAPARASGKGPAATPTALPSAATSQGAPVPPSYLSRIPTFPPAPEPEPMAVVAGPSAPSISRIATSRPVAFLTIDDGWTQTPEAVQLIRAARVPVTLFLSLNAMQNNPAYFKQLQDAGAVIEAHSLTHTNLRGMSYAFQKREICGSADALAGWYGRRPVFFRPPFGDKDENTLRAARDCGMRATFLWKETVDKGIVRYQEGRSIQRGDIILMHFRPAFVDDFLAALEAIHAAGLTPALLEDYVRSPESKVA